MFSYALPEHLVPRITRFRASPSWSHVARRTYPTLRKPAEAAVAHHEPDFIRLGQGNPPIPNCGLLQKGSLNLVPYASRIYNDRARHEMAPGFKRTYCHDCRPHLIGVWDTVGSMGWFWGRKFFDSTLNHDVKYGYHAVSIDEQRKKFPANMWREDVKADHQTIEQVWFAGVHSDVGGWYTDASLSDIALVWMLNKAQARCLRLRPHWRGRLSPRSRRSPPRFENRPVAAVEADAANHPARCTHPQERAGAHGRSSAGVRSRQPARPAYGCGIGALAGRLQTLEPRRSTTLVPTRPSPASSPMQSLVALLAFLALSWSHVAAIACTTGGSMIQEPAETAMAHHHGASQPTGGESPHSHQHQDPDHGECTMMLVCTLTSVEPLGPTKIRSLPAVAFRADRLVQQGLAIVDRSVDPPPPRHHI